jgi:hypothetical protein
MTYKGGRVRRGRTGVRRKVQDQVRGELTCLLFCLWCAFFLPAYSFAFLFPTVGMRVWADARAMAGTPTFDPVRPRVVMTLEANYGIVSAGEGSRNNW